MPGRHLRYNPQVGEAEVVQRDELPNQPVTLPRPRL